MKSPRRRRREQALERMLQTRSDAWAAVGLDIDVDRHDVRRAWQRLVLEVIVLTAAIVGEGQALDHIKDLAKPHKHFPYGTHWIIGKTPITIAAVLVLLVFGWLISRDLAKIAPAFFRRMDPATAGTVGFLTRFITVTATILGAFAVAGISMQALALGGAFTAVVLGLAAQQTLGNLFAGMVLLSARPFRVGERIRLQAGALGGYIEGVVSSLGLLYTTLSRGDDRLLVPNTVVLAAVVVPLKEPGEVDVRVTLSSGIKPTQVQALLEQNVSVATRDIPDVLLEEISGSTVIVRVKVTPEHHKDGPRLADEIIAALVDVTGEHIPVT